MNLARSRVLLFLFFFLAVFVLYSGAFRMYFVQDDFRLLTLARSPAEIDWKETLSLRAGYYRPVTQRILPAVGVWLFGYRLWAFHLTALLLFSINSCLLYGILKSAGVGKGASFVGVFFYITRSAHFLQLYWISAAAEAWMFLFFLLSLLFFHRSEKALPGGRLYFAASLACYVLMLSSKETGLLLPLVIFVWAGFSRGFQNSRDRFDGLCAFRRSWPFWVVLGLYLVLRILGGGLVSHGAYLLSTPERLGINVVAYAAMILDWNRELLRPFYLREWPPLTLLLFVWAVAFAFVWLVLPLAVLLKAGLGRFFDYREFVREHRSGLLVSVTWMAAGAVPPAVMTLSFYGYYLSVFFGGLALFVALHGEYVFAVLSRARSLRFARRVTGLALAALFLLSFASVRLQETLPHSNFQRAVEVRRVLERLRADLPPPPRETAIALTGLTRKQYWALGWGDALHVLYGDRDYRFYSEYEETRNLQNLPSNGWIELRFDPESFVLVEMREHPPVDS